MAENARDLIPTVAEPSQVPPLVVGRVPERRLLGKVLAAGGRRGGAVMLCGEPGVGKTTMLEWAAHARAGRTVWVRGNEAESTLAFAAAGDLLQPFCEHLDSLPAVHRRALESALALSTAERGSPLAVCRGALALLSAAAAREPVVALIDDLQWVDADSRRLIGFVARRLSEAPVVMVLAARDEPGGEVQLDGIAALRLTGLSLRDCEDLLRSRGVDVPPPSVASIVSAVEGNPLAVLEACGALGGAEAVAGDPGSETRRGHHAGDPSAEQLLHVPTRSVFHAWRRILEQLPARTRHGLFVIAVADVPGAPGLLSAFEALELSPADLAPAEALRLLVQQGDRLRLRHSVLREVIVAEAPWAVRDVTYRTLAALSTGETVASYYSSLLADPDGATADRLTDASQREAAGGNLPLADLLAVRAAKLTPIPASRAVKLLAAARVASRTGDARSAADRCAQALSLRQDEPFVAEVLPERAAALVCVGEPHRALDELTSAAGRLADAGHRAEVWGHAVLPALHMLDIGAAEDVASHAEADGAVTRTPLSFRTSGLVGLAYVLAGRADDGRTHLAAAHTGLLSAPDVDRFALAHVAAGHLLLDDADAALAAADTAVAPPHDTTHGLADALLVRADVLFAAGRWGAARAAASDCTHWARQQAQPLVERRGRLLLLRLDVIRGHLPPGAAEAEVAEAIGEDPELPEGAAVVGLALLAARRPAEAAEHLERAWDLARLAGVRHANAVLFVADLVEANIRAGHRDRAAEVLTWFAERAEASRAARASALAARCAALLVDDGERAARAFRWARQLLEAAGAPFELARGLLAEAESLRRAELPAEARPVLREALVLFERLEARPWVERVAEELAAANATADTAVPRPRVPAEELTAQERRIADMAASGRHNTEIAAALFISPKTVEAHLTRIYRKLAVRSRTELTALLLRTSGGSGPSRHS